MAKPYRLSPLAEADLEAIWLYTFKHGSMEQANSYHNTLVAAFEGLAAGLKRGRLADVLADFQKCLCGSHGIYFFDYADRLDIIRICINDKMYSVICRSRATGSIPACIGITEYDAGLWSNLA